MASSSGKAEERRQVEEVLKLEMLTPIVDFALPDDVLAGVFPVRDRGERRIRCRGSAGGPPVETDRWPGGLPLESFHGHTTIGSPKVFAIRKDVMMRSESLNSWEVACRHTNLIRHRIRFEIDQATYIMVLGAQFLGPTEIEDRICFAVEAYASPPGHGLHSTCRTRQEREKSSGRLAPDCASAVPGMRH